MFGFGGQAPQHFAGLFPFVQLSQRMGLGEPQPDQLGLGQPYCTSSPDSYLSADFRGPCARHDMCYEKPGNHKTSCDATFAVQLVNNCDYAYGSLNPLRYTCRDTAMVYYGFVTALGDDS